MSKRVCNILLPIGLVLGAGWIPVAFFGCGAGETNDPPRVKIGSMVWDVDLATTNQQRYQGLSGRKYLDQSVGMLFVYPDSAPRAYCMRDCFIPIDIAFINSDLQIVKIYTMPTEPGRIGRVSYPSIAPAQYVLEVAAGGFSRNGVAEGSKVTLLGNIPDPTKAAPGP